MPGNWDRLNTRALYPSDNEWGIPTLPPATVIPDKLVPYSDRRAVASAVSSDAVHFFLDDYRFETMWSKPERGLTRVQSVGTALTPDFSLWRDMPLVMQLWQVYRARWCGAWMLAHGVQVIPTVGWSTKSTFDFAFAGVCFRSVVAVSTVGLLRDMEAQRFFHEGFQEMMIRIKPVRVLVYGHELPMLRGYPVTMYPTRWKEKV